MVERRSTLTSKLDYSYRKLERMKFDILGEDLELALSTDIHT